MTNVGAVVLAGIIWAAQRAKGRRDAVKQDKIEIGTVVRIGPGYYHAGHIGRVDSMGTDPSMTHVACVNSGGCFPESALTVIRPAARAWLVDVGATVRVATGEHAGRIGVIDRWCNGWRVWIGDRHPIQAQTFDSRQVECILPCAFPTHAAVRWVEGERVVVEVDGALRHAVVISPTDGMSWESFAEVDVIVRLDVALECGQQVVRVAPDQIKAVVAAADAKPVPQPHPPLPPPRPPAPPPPVLDDSVGNGYNEEDLADLMCEHVGDVR